jgi:hypothetical protein
VPVRTPRQVDPEWQARTVKIRGAARKGKRPAEIADLYKLPLAAVERVLAPVEHPRLSDPVQLFLHASRTRGDTAPADVQVYWVGFLMAAGYIRGHGTSLTLVVPVGAEGRDRIASLLADLLSDHIRWEFCYSNMVGWQAYLRDQIFCKALIPWGVPSDLCGEDPTVIDDLPEGLVVPFLRGFVDGGALGRAGRSSRRRTAFAIRGTPAMLTGINALVKRHWGVSNGVVTRSGEGVELRFADPAARRAIQNQLDAIPSRF